MNKISTHIIAFVATICLLPLASHAQDISPTLWRRGWRLAIGGGGQLILNPYRQQALTNPLIQFPVSGPVFRFTQLEWFWNAHWGATIYFNVSKSTLPDEAAFRTALNLRYPGQFLTFAAPLLPEYTNAEVLQVLIGVKYQLLCSRRWCFQPGLAIGSTEFSQYPSHADIKQAGTHALINLWLTPDSASFGPKPAPFTLAASGTGVYTLSRRWNLFVQMEYAWIKPKLRWEFIELDQSTGMLKKENIEYRRALHGLNVTLGVAFHL